MSKFIHTFTDDDAGKTFRLTASLLNNQSITDSITIKCNKKPVEPEEPECRNRPKAGGFISGVSGIL